jgi:hypothetical protein
VELVSDLGVLDALLVDGVGAAERETEGVVVDEREGQAGFPFR